MFLNYHITTGLKLDLEFAEGRLWKRKKWEFRMKYLWWKCEERDRGKKKKARNGAGEPQNISEKRERIKTRVPSRQCQGFSSPASLLMD